ncbi:MAG: glycosyltransferase family 4 protein [Endomicrobiales bacterium]
MTTLRIGMLISRFHPVEGGAEIQCRRLSLELNKSDCAVFVLTQKLRGLPRLERFESLPVLRLALPPANRLGSLMYFLSGFWWLMKNNRRFDLLHAHLASSPAVLAALVSRVLRKPAILKIAGSRTTGDIGTSSRTWYGRLKLAYLRKNLDAFVCPSREARDELVRAGFDRAKIQVIPNGVSTEIFSPASQGEKKTLRQALGIPGNATVVIYTGRLEPGKGLETLLDAWPRAAGAQAHLYVLGTGSLEQTLRSRASGEGEIHFTGWKRNTVDYLRAADIFVLPSFGEGLPNSLIEAMSCGLACVATDIGGVTELITSGKNGVLVAPGDAPQLAAALTRLITAPEARALLGKEARAHAESTLSIGRTAGQYRELYARLTRDRNKEKR